ncbi:AMP-binding protein [Mycolicibacterium goodii]|uniref:non-ribosomal peptide synthetase n=1 Tax=Mycolicibacterium goodii TaxID=134601 RepID=UPI001BDC600A|nr:non-ribosomal peptide synthetase [Mycolicibacterium goodii]MBU8817459.1 AMP-binding protein [Mycolicibacterium goodii]
MHAASRALLDALRAHGNRTALITGSRQMTYSELAGQVADAVATMGAGRRLVLLETHNDIATVVGYLAALAAGHVVLPVAPGGDHTAIIGTYSPDTVIDADGIRHRRDEPAHRLHEDLALLMSTSGSTGSPKLVRLSRTNLLSNATAIAEYLGIRETDRAATTLPLSYCYGLSVLNSHLLRGAALILTEDSVLDDAFWDLFTEHRGTSFAGVPHTFELLDRIGFDTMSLPHLRYITQAGGRMAPERVRRFAVQAQRQGWRLVVMYGATEATARMAYLPADLALTRPDAIGKPIPGGEFTIEQRDGWPDGTGELVYRGPNVMLGYAHGPDDLASGATLDALRTGDIARRGADGLFEIVGRSSRFVKLFGLRIDLQRLESGLAEQNITALCTGDDDGIAVAATAPAVAAEVTRLVAAAARIPASGVRTAIVDELPRLTSGKPDYPAVRALARAGARSESVTDLRSLFADVLQLDPAVIDPEASFVDLGGNSLSYVAMSVRLERALGQLPADWHRLPLSELERRTTRRRRWGATVETSVALRAVAIVLIVGSHAELFELWGGAHVLLAVAGYNFGRFCLTPLPREQRSRHLRRTIAWIAVPSIVWVAIALLLTDDYHVTNLFLADKFLGPPDSMTAGRLWFVEVLVWILVALAAVCWLPAADRLERRRPFAFAAAFLAFGLAVRYHLISFDVHDQASFTVLAFWFFAAGWAAAKATHTWQRVAVTVVLAVAVYGYFGDPNRELLVLAGFALLIWLPALRCPAPVAVVLGVLAEASLYTYLTHYQIYPLFGDHRLVGVLAALAVGAAVTYAVTSARTRWSRRSVRGPLGHQALLHERGDHAAAELHEARGDDAAATGRGR